MKRYKIKLNIAYQQKVKLRSILKLTVFFSFVYFSFCLFFNLLKSSYYLFFKVTHKIVHISWYHEFFSFSLLTSLVCLDKNQTACVVILHTHISSHFAFSAHVSFHLAVHIRKIPCKKNTQNPFFHLF